MAPIFYHRTKQVKQRQLTNQDVHDMALETLQKHLPLQGRSEKSSPEKVLGVLLGAAAHGSSIEEECNQGSEAPSPNTVRGVLRESLDLSKAEEGLNKALAERLARRYWKRKLEVAVDLHLRPYHGQPETEESEVSRGPAKSGTTHFHAYATAYVVRRGRRVTLALHFVPAGESMTRILDLLKARLDALGLKVKLWLCDRGFCQVEALQWLARQPLAYVPLVVRGKKEPPSSSRRLQALRHSQWAHSSMKSSSSGKVLKFDVAVVRRRRERTRGTGELRGPRTLLYCVVGTQMAHGPGSLTPEVVADGYQGRFGIESSYRQLGQGLLRTSSRSPVLRLLAVGIALILRNLWVLCCWISATHPGPGRRSLRNRLRLTTVLRWVAQVAEQRLGFGMKIELAASSPRRL